MSYYDPIKLTARVYEIVVKRFNDVEERKYYRFRGGEWYGGIATGDAVGCNLRCRFCWAWKIRDNPAESGRFYKPSEVYKRLINIAGSRGYWKVRVSGCEPTISRRHLIQLLEYFSREETLFILETNGLLIGMDKSYAKDLSRYKNLHVRVSLKGCSEEEFHMLTGADPDIFNLQLKSLEYLINYDVSCHPAVMLSFSSRENFNRLKERIWEIDPQLTRSM